MPFYVEKGPLFSVIESYVLDDRERGISLLDTLRAGGPAAAGVLSPIAEGIGLDSTVLDAGGTTGKERKQHIDEHWFERGVGGSGTGTKDPAPHLPVVEPNGQWHWWHGYAGDVYEIMRQTMITAAEVSLGIAAGADARLHGRQDPWPIELFWHCGQNWFEGWVTWRRHGPAGQVTVLLCTPTAGSPIRPTPLASGAPTADKGRAGAAPYSDKPQPHGKSRGMVVVTHHHHDFVQGGDVQVAQPKGRRAATPPPPAPEEGVHVVQHRSQQGSLATFTADYWRGGGPVVRVMPSEPDGGVLPGGRSYTS